MAYIPSQKVLDNYAKVLVNFALGKGKGIKKDISEDIEEIQGQTIDWIAPQNEVFVYLRDVYDWVSGSGEVLSDYEPTKEDLKVINQEYKPQKITH